MQTFRARLVASVGLVVFAVAAVDWGAQFTVKTAVDAAGGDRCATPDGPAPCAPPSSEPARTTNADVITVPRGTYVLVSSEHLKTTGPPATSTSAAT